VEIALSEDNSRKQRTGAVILAGRPGLEPG
jgi:hypothetical protein